MNYSVNLQQGTEVSINTKQFKQAVLMILFFVLFNGLFAQSFTIEYFGVISSETDANMSKMTSDLYYTQLCEINSFSIIDRRSDIEFSNIPDTSQLSKENLSFYAVIQKKENSTKWLSTLYLIDNKNKAARKDTKEFDSYYKILMEPKNSLQETIKGLIENKSNSELVEDIPFNNSEQGTAVSTEFLSGNWECETNNELIDKIVIMRGGRGFIVFENGATMNITLEIITDKGVQKLQVLQKGRTNASYFPELSRSIALKEAVNAAPIKWTFAITNQDKLTGSKETLIEQNDSAIPGLVNVCWIRKS